MLYLSRGLSSKGRNVRRPNNDYTELEVKITQTFWTLHASESTGKDGSYCAAGMTGPRGNWTVTPQWK